MVIIITIFDHLRYIYQWRVPGFRFFTFADEKWMEISEEDFNKLLEERFGVKGVNVTDSPEMLSNTINKFLHSASDLEGVEFKNENLK